jgi:hypothetical protein
MPEFEFFLDDELPPVEADVRNMPSIRSIDESHFSTDQMVNEAWCEFTGKQFVSALNDFTWTVYLRTVEETEQPPMGSGVNKPGEYQEPWVPKLVDNSERRSLLRSDDMASSNNDS